jgi:prepilin-type N-terminal cleavage/methylation domain-containing protein
MTSRTSRPRDDSAIGRPAGERAFTLLELILVMALLSIAVAISFPTLRSFFRGRELDDEARRLLALTRYGQSRAIAEGAPMVLWIDEREGAYGLAMAAGMMNDDPRALEFTVAENLELRVEGAPRTATFNSRAASQAWTVTQPTAEFRVSRSRSGLPLIRFLPDGFIDRASPWHVEIREDEKNAVWLVQTTNRLAYELRSERPTAYELRDFK